MGHAHLDTTNLYAQANLETKRQALNQLDSGTRPGKHPRWKQNDILSWNNVKEGPPDFRTDRGDANPPSHYGELTINLLIASSRLVDRDAPPAVANMPLRGEVLVPCAEVLGIGGAGGRAAAPDP